jgi:hypothetical protein
LGVGAARPALAVFSVGAGEIVGDVGTAVVACGCSDAAVLNAADAATSEGAEVAGGTGAWEAAEGEAVLAVGKVATAVPSLGKAQPANSAAVMGKVAWIKALAMERVRMD